MTNYRLMQVESIAEFCNTLTFIKLPFAIKFIVLSIFEWPFYTGFTVRPEDAKITDRLIHRGPVQCSQYATK